jgi:hypothetical protein
MLHDFKTTTFVADSNHGEVLLGTSLDGAFPLLQAMGYIGCGVTTILVLNPMNIERSHVVSSIRKKTVVSLKGMKATPFDFHECGGRRVCPKLRINFKPDEKT